MTTTSSFMSTVADAARCSFRPPIAWVAQLLAILDKPPRPNTASMVAAVSIRVLIVDDQAWSSGRACG